MPRTSRKISKTKVYHVIFRGNDKQDIFFDNQDYRKFIKEIRKTKEKYQNETSPMDKEESMAKSKIIFVCSECGNESAKWLGKCPACNSWNSFYEQKIVENKNSKHVPEGTKTSNTPQKLNSYEAKEAFRTHTGFGELDRVLGGGLVKGSLVLLGGEPGIGKSTLILQICDKVKGEGKVLYVSGEESAEQIKSRADRLGINNEDILFLGETDIDIVNQAIINVNPKLVIIDSIQTMYSDEITAAAGSVSQVREITRTSYESL